MNVELATQGASLGASVCICTYNGAGRLGAVLEALKLQTEPSHTWEVIVIDNASTDDTATVAANLINSLLQGRGRVVFEAQPGLSFARARAGREARGKIVCFLDDDNVPSPNFVAVAVRAFGEYRKAGALGGKVLPVWESTPTPLALAVQDFALAIADRGEKPFRYEESLGPVGAGLCIKTEVLRRIYQDEKSAEKVIGRTTHGFGCGEDVAIGYLVWEFGYECWYEPSLVVQHLLPARRMEKDYLLKLYAGIGRGQAAVRRLYDWKARTPLALLIAAKDFARWLKKSCRQPAPVPEAKSESLAQDLNDLEKHLVLGRALGALVP